MPKHVSVQNEALLRQQSTLAQFGELALTSENLDEILTEACRLVADALGTEMAKILELQEDGETLLVRAGVGWKPGVVGVVLVCERDGSSDWYALGSGEPVASPDILAEQRFNMPPFLHDNGVRGLVNVVIIGGKDQRPFGVLEVDSRVPRHFDENDVAFLRGYANLVAAAVDRLRILAELKRREAFAQGVLGASPDCVKVLDGDGTLRFMNQRGRDISGLSEAEVEGHDYPGLWPQPEQDRIRAAIRQSLTGTVPPIEVHWTTTQGEPRWFELRFAPLAGIDGEPTRVVGVTRDITDRVLAEAARRRGEEQLHAVFEAVPVGIVVCDAPSGRIVVSNPMAARVFGQPILEAPDIQSYTKWVAFHPDGRRVAATEFPLARALAGEEQPSLEVLYQFPDGSRGWILLSAAPVHDAAGAITGAIVAAQDIDLQKRAAAILRQSNSNLQAQVRSNARDLENTNRSLLVQIEERQAAEGMVRQLQKMEAVGQLTGGIAHDFNNMLAVVLSGLTLVQRRLARGDTDVNRFIDAALDGARRAGLLTQRLLAFSRQQTLSPLPLDANRLLSGMTELLHRTLGEAVQVETVLAAGLWLTHADPNQLENAVLNLAVNGRDAMNGSGKLTVETANTRLDDDYARAHEDVVAGQYVMIAISDTGTGMGSEVMSRVFEPYFTTKEVGKGTGLGLSQVYGFVKQSGGHIKIYSELGRGTSMKVYLPRFYGEVPSDAQDSPVAVPEPGSSDRLVLIVEDEARVRELTVAAVRELGYSAIHADGGVAALRQLDAHPELALLFTDVVMADMNGRELVDEALRRRPGLRVLFTTGYAKEAVVHNGVLPPNAPILPKPFSLEQLAAKIHDVIGPA